MTPEFVYNRLPDDIIKNSPKFVHFIQSYYQWAQEQGHSAIINNYRDLLNQQVYNKEYEDRIVKNFGVDISIIESSNVKTELLYKLLDEFLETRGTKTSFEILFRMMFNEQVEINYPRDTLLRPSSSKYLRTSLILMTGNFPMSISSNIRGIKSNTNCSVESFIPYYIGNVRYYLVECNNIYDEFLIGEPLEISTLDYSYTEVHVPLIDLEIINPGIGYKKGDKIIPSINKFEGNFIVKSVSKGSIDSIEIINPGIGYKKGDKIRTNQSSHFDAYIDKVSNDGVVEGIKIRNKGYNFEEIPEYSVNSENGTGLILLLKSKTIGNVKEISISDGSVVYTPGNITYSINSENGSGLVVKSKISSCYYLNRYLNKEGFLSYNSTLLDSYTKHSHSYNIISSVPAIKYVEAVTKYANPSGYVFNKMYSTENSITLSNIEVTGELTRE